MINANSKLEDTMKHYPIPMVPGPVSVPEVVLQQYQYNYGSGDLEPEFLELYNHTEENLQRIFATKNRVAIQSGEGMLALWGALKSCLQPGDPVLAVATGVFGYGIGDMAKSIGAVVRTIGLPYNKTIYDLDEIEKAIIEHKPKMITAVHCETPSGTLNPLAALGELKRKYEVPLFYVDMVASLGGTPVLTDEWTIDLALGGTQKCLSAPPGMAFVAISEPAWEVIAQVGYAGYDALLPFQEAQANFYFPYTPYWHGLAALCAATELLLSEGLENSYARHQAAASACRNGLEELGLTLYPAKDAIPSPTVTAVNVPDGMTWGELDGRFRQLGLAAGGSYGPLSGKVFRLGHMGAQANLPLVQRALEVIRQAL
jgi:aspartate aminotransferase-like enzyme